MIQRAQSPTRFRFWVLAVLCSLAFLTYLDRICIMRAQGDIIRTLRAEIRSLKQQVAILQKRARGRLR